MGKIKNNSQSRKRNPIRISKAIFGGLAMNKYNSRLILLFFIIGLLTTFFASAVVNADPLDTWTSRHSGGNNFNGVAFGNGTFVAVGDNGTIFTSPDGIAWTQRFPTLAYSLNGITYGYASGTGDIFIAVGDHGTILTSPDGISWTPKTSGKTGDLNGIAYGNGTFVAVGDTLTSGVILTSTDGNTWTPQGGSLVSRLLNGVTYGGGTFVAVGQTTVRRILILTSPDGITWTQQAVPPPYFVPLYGVTYGNGTFVTVGDYARILTSPDGVNWTHGNLLDYNVWGVTHGNGTFVAVGAECSFFAEDGSCVDPYGRILSSTDSNTWTPRISSGYYSPLNGITYGNGTFVAVGDNGIILQSDPIGPTLTVTKSGPGTGTVRSQVEGINCGSDCTESYNTGTVVTLTAAPATGSYFAGWSDGTNTSQALTWKVTMDAAKSVTATFTSGTPPTMTWAKTYGDLYADVAQSIQQTSDGGYIVAGYSSSFGPEHRYNFWILKLKADGTAAWQKYYPMLWDEHAYSIQQTSDGGYIVAGTTTTNPPGFIAFLILKLNSDGTVAWGNSYGGTGYDYANSVQQTSDGGYIVAGSTTSFGDTNGDCWILKLNPDGTVAWQKTYGGTGADVANFVQQTLDGGYIVVGVTDSFGAGSDDALLLKLDADGNVAWQKTYGGTLMDSPNSIQQTSDGGYVVAGVTNSFSSSTDFWVTKLDPNGNATWSRIYGGSNTSYAYSIQQTSDGGYIVAGWTNGFGAGGADAWVLKLYADGSVAWQKTYGNLATNYTYSIQQTSDGGYIVAGSDTTDFWVMKLDSNGNMLGCPAGLIGTSSAVAGTPTLTITTPAPTIGNTSATITNFSGVTPLETSITPGEVCTGLEPNISVSPTSYDFGLVRVDSHSLAQGFLISNNGNRDLQITSIGKSGGDLGMFNVATGTCPSLTPTIISGGSCTITATFWPTSAGAKSATLTINSNDPDTPILNVPLSGTGVIGLPAIPTLSSPPDGSSTGGVATLTWNDVFGALTYTLQISLNPTFGAVIVNLPGLTGFSQDFSGQQNTTYYWRVKATNLVGDSGWSEVWSFTVVPGVPPPPYLSSPSNGSTQSTSPTLVWGVSGGATKWWLQVSTDQTFATTFINDNNVLETIHQISGLSIGITYYWRVAAWNSSGWGSFSAPPSFNTACFVFPYGGMPPIYPSSGGMGTVPVEASDSTCTWTAVSNDPWITITSPSGGNGTGSGTVEYSVAGNPGIPRMGTMTIAGGPFMVSQDQGQGISGLVTNATGTLPIANVYVYANDPFTHVTVGSTNTNASGNYTFYTPPGSYTVGFAPPAPTVSPYYAPEWYNNRRNNGQADAVAVTAGQITININARLETGGKIAGRVTDTSPTPGAIPNVSVGAFNSNQSWVGGAITDSNGYYSLLAYPGAYRVYFDTKNIGDYVPEWYDNFGNFSAATLVSVVADATTTLNDAQLTGAGIISGRVTDPFGDGLADVSVTVSIPLGLPPYSIEIYDTSTDADGNYTALVTPRSDYKVQFNPAFVGPYSAEWYNNKSIIGTADQVAVTGVGIVTPNIGAQLSFIKRVQVVNIGVSNGKLLGVFVPFPGFRELVKAATLTGPNSFSYQYDLQVDTLNYMSECYYYPGWLKSFDAAPPPSYGIYTLTVEFFDGMVETYTKDLIEAHPVVPESLQVTFDAAGNAYVSFSFPSTPTNQYYQLRVRSNEDNKNVSTEYYVSDTVSITTTDYTVQIPAQALRCLEKGQTYRWLVRTYDDRFVFDWSVNIFNAAETSYVLAAYDTALSGQRTTDYSAYVWGGNLALYFAVRPGSRDQVTQATVDGPGSPGFHYQFDLINDHYDYSTATRISNFWGIRFGQPITTLGGYGTYTFNITFSDGHTDTLTKNLQNFWVTGVNSATMVSEIFPTGDVSFRWGLPISVSQYYVARIRSRDNTKEYWTGPLNLDYNNIHGYFTQYLKGLEHCKTYRWFVRAYNTGNYQTADTMVESGPQYFFYNPFGLPFNTLTVTNSGSGAGTVVSSLAGINCGIYYCSDTYVQGLPVTLTATPDPGSTLTSWSGCDSVNGNQCMVTMATDKSVIATFDVLPSSTLTVTKSGTGTVTSSPAGINCGTTCNASYIGATMVTLTATPDSGFSFTNWSGCDSTNGVQCTVTMPSSNASRGVTATFGPCTYSISPTSALFDSNGGNENIAVQSSHSTCAWTTTNNDNDMIINLIGDSGTGDGEIYYEVVLNTYTTSRAGTLTIGGQTFTVTQAALASALSAPMGVQFVGQPVVLQWSSVGGATGYKVYYGTSSGNYQTSIDVGTNTSYTIPTLPIGSTYFFAVTAYNASGETVFSDEAVLLSYDADGDGNPDYMAVSTAPKPPSGGSCTDGDGDGLCDTQDNCPTKANNGTKGTCLIGKTACTSTTQCTAFAGDSCITTQVDSDGDGYGDACDTCPDVANRDQTIPKWYKDFDNDGYSDGTIGTSCNRPKVCSTDTSLVCTPILASSACGACSGTWTDTLNGGFAYKKLEELAFLPNQQRATAGDCDDNNPNVHPGATETLGNTIDDDCNPATPDIDYEIVFVNMVENGVVLPGNTPIDAYFNWLPKDGATITATAMVRKISTGAVIPATITLSPVSPNIEITRYPGRYSNDPNTATTDDFSNVSVLGEQISLTCEDFGGMITFHFNASFTDGANYTLTNQLVRLPRDTDGDGIADAWEMANFGTLSYGPNDGGPNDATGNNLDKDGLTNFDEYRGFMWGQLVPNDGSYGQCSITKTRNCSTNASCPAGQTCVPYGYQTAAYVPVLDPANGMSKMVHLRTDPRRKNLFVKYTNYDGDYPFAIGLAYLNQAIDVHAADASVIPANSDRKIDVLSITHELSNTFISEDPNLYRRSVRDWTFKTLGLSGFGNTTTYGSALTYKRVLEAYFSNKPFKDNTTLRSSSSSLSNGPWDPPDGKLNPIARVEDANDNGKKDGGEDKSGNGQLDGDYPVPLNACSSGPPWNYNQQLSPFNINNNYYNGDPNRPLIELPVASNPDTVNAANESTREQVLKHVITHELGHALGITFENADSTCVMYQYSNNWIRDGHFSTDAAALIRVHNCCPTD
jgi:uncharacterized delta-60 repeat protein